MKTYGNVKALVHAFLTSAVDEDERPVQALITSPPDRRLGEP
jgi:hypothetical protein